MKRFLGFILKLIIWLSINVPLIIVINDNPSGLFDIYLVIAWAISGVIVEFAIRKWVNNVLEIKE